MSDRVLQLILKANDQASAEIRKLRQEIEALTKVQFSNTGIAQLGQQAQEAQGKAQSLFGTLSQGNVSALEGITKTAFAFNQVTLAIQGVIAAARPAYDFLIQQNVELQNQLLATQSTLAATNRVFSGGEEIKDPTQAIKALEGPVNDAIARVRKGSLELVGVTSQQLVPIFQNIAGQSASINASLDDSADLTLKFAAALGTLKIPLEQQRQEVSSILQGQITQDSILAKSIGLNNQLIEKYRAQGTLVQFLNQRLEAFSAGNKLAAQTIDGVASNIAEIFEEISRQAGQPLLDPLVKALQSVFEFLQKNQVAIVAGAKTVIDVILQSANNIGQSLQPALQATVDIITNGVPLVQQFFIIFAQGVTTTTELLSPLINLLMVTIAKAVEGYQKITELILAKQIADADIAIESYAGTVNQLAGEAFKAAEAQKALNDARAKGGQLTPQQLAQEEALKANSKAVVASIDEQIAALKQLSTFRPEQANSVQGLISQLEASKRALGSQGLAGETKLALKQAEDLGTAFEQLTNKLKENEGAIARSQTTEEVNKALKTRIELIQKAIDLGRLTPQDGQNELEKIANNSKANFDIVKAAQDSIVKVRKQALDQQLSDEKAALAETEANAKRGVITLEQAAKDATAIKKRQLDAQLEDLRTQIRQEQDAIERGRGSPQRLAQLKAQEKELNAQIVNEEIAGREKVQQARERESSIQKANLDAQIKDIQAAVQAGTIAQVEGAKRVTALKKEQLDRQLADLDEAIAEEEAARQRGEGSPQRAAELAAKRKALLAEEKLARVDAEKAIQDAALREVQRAQEKATSLAKLAETERLQEIQKLINAGVISKQDAEGEKLKAVRATLEEELKISQENQKKIEAIPKSNNPLVEEDRQKLIRNARQKTADLTLRLLENEKLIRDARQKTTDLTLRLLENEKTQQEAALELFKRKQDEIALSIKNSSEQQKLGFEKQLQLIDSSNKLLERRSQLLEVQKSLIKSAADLQQSQFRSAIDLLQSQFETQDKILDRQKQREELQKRAAQGDTNAAQELADLDRKEARERAVINLRIEAKQAEIAALNQQQALEQQSLILEEQKTRLLQRQEEIRLRIALADAKSQQAQAVAEAAKTAADPNATAGQKQAAQISLQAATQKVGFAQEALALQQSIAGAIDEEFAARRQTLANQQQQQQTEKQIELQTLRNQGFALSPLQQGTPEDIARQRAVAAEDARRRASVQAEEARLRGFSTPLQQAQQSRIFEQAQGQFLTTGGLGAAGSQQLQSSVLDQARSPIESLASQQTNILAESKGLQQKTNEYLAQLVEFAKGNAPSSRGGLNNTINISGNIDPRRAAAIAQKKIEDALYKAIVGASR